MLVVPFNIREPWTGEAVASIGMNLIFLSFIVMFDSITVNVASLGVLLVVKELVPLNVMFNPLEVLSFMILGSLLAMNPPQIKVRFRPLEFLGRYALWFYVGHYLIIWLIGIAVG